MYQKKLITDPHIILNNIGKQITTERLSNIPTVNISQKNYIIARVWLSQFSGGENVGHASLETSNGKYISLWPMGSPSGKLTQFFEKRTSSFVTYQDDLILEGRNPEVTIHLYSLNILKLENAFIQAQTNIGRWTLFGRNLISGGNTNSCSGLVYDLLREAGIRYFVSDDNAIRDFLSTTPDNVAELVIKTKAIEVLKYPQVEKYPGFPIECPSVFIKNENTVQNRNTTQTNNSSIVPNNNYSFWKNPSAYILGIGALAVGVIAVKNQLPKCNII